LAIKNNEIVFLVATYMRLKDIMLREIRQIQNDSVCFHLSGKAKKSWSNDSTQWLSETENVGEKEMERDGSWVQEWSWTGGISSNVL
jgi:hypothetical protein